MVNLEQLSPAITRDIKMNRKKEVSKMSGSLEDSLTEIQGSTGVENPAKDEDGLRYKSGRKRRSCVKLTGDEEGEEKEEEEGKKKRRRRKTHETCHMMLRSHQSASKPFKEKESRDVEKCLGFNNNENDGEENVNETETSEEELDLRLELDEEELLAQNDEDKK